MPTVTEETTSIYLHCRDAKCAGYEQEEVQGVKRTTALTYLELGGDAPGFERSFDQYVPVDGVDLACPSCEKDREVSPQVRPEYAPISGQDPMALLHQGKQEGRLRELEHSKELAELQSQKEMAELKQVVAAQQAQIQALLGAKEEKPKRKEAA